MIVEPFLSPADVAELQQVTVRTIRDQVKAGLLPVYRINARVLRFKRSEVEAALAKLRIPARAERAGVK